MALGQIELLFTPRLIPDLTESRGDAWKNFLISLSRFRENSLQQTAFVLMMARLVNCTTCNANSFRASQGCFSCSQQVLKRYHGSDQQLIKLYEIAEKDVHKYVEGE